MRVVAASVSALMVGALLALSGTATAQSRSASRRPRRAIRSASLRPRPERVLHVGVDAQANEAITTVPATAPTSSSRWLVAHRRPQAGSPRSPVTILRPRQRPCQECHT